MICKPPDANGCYKPEPVINSSKYTIQQGAKTEYARFEFIIRPTRLENSSLAKAPPPSPVLTTHVPDWRAFCSTADFLLVDNRRASNSYRANKDV